MQYQRPPENVQPQAHINHVHRTTMHDENACFGSRLLIKNRRELAVIPVRASCRVSGPHCVHNIFRSTPEKKFAEEECVGTSRIVSRRSLQ